MELELGLKITRTREDVSSSVDFRFSKDPFGPLVLSRETDSKFIIIIHLKGFKKEGIEIEINKEGNRITIRGRKAVEEMVLIRWMAWKKEVELRAFKKVFLIPDVVDLDKIKARFEDDDATLTITMPKRVKGMCGFKLEQEEEEKEESVDFGDVSEAENIDYGTQREEEFGEMMEDQESESQLEGFSEGLDEEETQIEDDDLETVGQQESADSNTEIEDSSLRKLPDILEQENNQEVMEQQLSRVVSPVTKSDDSGSRAFEEIEKQEPDEKPDKTSKSGATEKKTTDDDGDGLSKVQAVEEPERHSEGSKIQDMVQGKGLEEKKKTAVEIKSKDAKEEFDGKMGEVYTPNIEKARVVGEDDIAETETTGKKHELVEKKEEEEENSKLRRQNEDRNLTKLQEREEQHSKQENIANDVPEPVRGTENTEVDTLGETDDEGKQGKVKKKSLNLEVRNRDAKEEVDAKMGEPNIAETETKSLEFGTEKLEALEVDKIHEVVEKKEEKNAKVGTESEDISLIKPPDIGDQQSQGKKRQDKHEKIKELVKEQAPEAETNIVNDTPKAVQERCEGKHKIQKLFQEETKKQPEEHKEKMVERGKKINGAGSRENQEIIRLQKLDEPERCEKETKTLELVKSRTSDEEKDEKEIAETETKEQESYRPKILGEQEKIKELSEEKKSFSNNGKIKEEEEIAEKKTEFGGDDISRKVGDFEQRDLDAKEKVDGEMGKGFTPDSAETETKEKLESDEIHELVEKKEEEEHNAKDVRRRTEDSSLIKKLQETKEQQFQGQKRRNKQETIKELVEEKVPVAETNITHQIPKPVQEIEEPEVDTFETCEEKEIAEKEEKEQESDKRKILAEEKANFLRKNEDEEDIAEKKTEFGDDDMSRKVRDSDAMKGQEEKDKTRESVVEEKVSDGRKGIVAVGETIGENYKSRKFQEIDEQQSHEEDKRGNQFQKLIGGETSGHGEVEDVENEKKTEADKRFRDSAREAQAIERKDSDVPGRYDTRDTMQELQENITTYQNEQGEEKEVEADRQEKVTGDVELVNLNSHVEQDNVEDVEDKTSDCKEEESETKTDDVGRKVEGIKEQELFEPKRDHLSKIKEVVEEKIAESEIEDECCGLSNVKGSEKQELHELNIHKQRDKTRINGAEEPSGQEKEEEEKKKIVESMTKTEKENSPTAQDIKEEQLDKPESHEERYKIQELVEAGHNDHKEEQKDEKPIVKKNRETEKDGSKKVQEIEKQESDGRKRSMVDAKKEETEEKEIPRPMEEKVIVERRTKTKHGSLRKVQDDADPELSQPYKRQEDEIQEPVEMGTSKEPGKPNPDEFKRHGEQRLIPQLVNEEKMENIVDPGGKLKDDNSGKFHEFEERKSYDDFTKEEATDPEDKHTGEAGHSDNKEEQQEEKDMAKAELKSEEDSSEKVQKIEKHESDELQRSLVQDKKKKSRAMEENEDMERRTETKDGSLKKVRDGKKPELDRRKRSEEEDKIQEPVEMGKSDSREKFKKKDELDSGELERYCKERKIHQSVEDEKGEGKMEKISEPGGKTEGDSSGEFHEFQKKKSYEDWRQEESEEIENLVKEEATGPKDKHRGGKEEHEEERYAKVAQTKTTVEDGVDKKVGENQKEEENLVDDSMTKIQETEKEESHEAEIHEKLDRVPYFVEDKTGETGDQEDEKAEEAAAAVANNEKDSLRKLHSSEGEELQEPEEHKEQNKVPETSDPEVKEEDEEKIDEKVTKEREPNVQELEGGTDICKDVDREGKRGEIGKQRKTVETKSDDRTLRKIPETKVLESNEKKDQEPADKETSNQEVKLVTENDSLRKGQDFLKKDSNVSKRRPVQEEKIQKPKEVGKEEQVNEDEEKAEVDVKRKDGKSRKFKLLEMQQLNESEENGEQRKIRKPIEEKEESEKIAEEEIQEKMDSGINDQEITGQELYEGGGYKTVLKTKSTEGSSQSQDVKEKGSDQTGRYAEQETIQELVAEKRGKEEYHIREGEQNEKAKRIPQVESKANDGSSKRIETERLRRQEKKEDHQEVVEIGTSDQRKEEREEKIVGKSVTRDEYDSSRKNHEYDEEHSDKQERHGEEEMSGSLAKEETSDDKEESKGNRAGAETKIRDDGFKEEELAMLMRHREHDKKQKNLEKDISGKAKENRYQETKSRDDSSRKTLENENQESHEQKRNYEDQDKKNLGPNYCTNKEDGNEDKEIVDAEGPRKFKGIEKRVSTKAVERHENQDNVNELVKEKMNNQEGEDKKSMFMKVLAKSEDHESKGPERLRKQDKSREEVQQRLTDNLTDEERAKTETKIKNTESRKIHQPGEEERRKEKGRIKELVEDRIHSSREIEFEVGCSKKIQDIDNEKSTESGRDKKRCNIQEPVDSETSEGDEEELDIEVEDSEEDWEAEVIQEMDSDEDNDKSRQIRRIKLGFRLVGESTLFMSLIVIVIRFIRSKRKIRCYKF